MQNDFDKIFTEWEKTHKIINKDKDVKSEDNSKNVKKNKETELSIDLHHLTKNEALMKLKSFIIDNQTSFLQKIRIIHGRGSHSKDKSVLKIAVIEWLKNNSKFIKFYRPGKTGEGSFGVTVAYINPK